MSTEPLTTTLDVRKAAARGASVSGVLEPQNLAHFNTLLASSDGEVNVDLTFSKDEEGRHIIEVAIVAQVMVICQRCLEPMATQLGSRSTLAVVLNDEQAALLPKHLDPLVLDEQNCNLWDLVEEELILAMKPFSYHDTQDCKDRMKVFSHPPIEEVPVEKKPNPFDVLADLKPSK